MTLGFKVAICEQMQDPREAKGLVERESSASSRRER